jgi:hypothetical protein
VEANLVLLPAAEALEQSGRTSSDRRRSAPAHFAQEAPLPYHHNKGWHSAGGEIALPSSQLEILVRILSVLTTLTEGRDVILRTGIISLVIILSIRACMAHEFTGTHSQKIAYDLD